MKKLLTNIEALSNSQLIKLSEELKQTTVPDDALLRKVIKDTEHDTTAPMITFVAVGQLIGFVACDRLKAFEDIDFL